jgi:hypothetical protein
MSTGQGREATRVSCLRYPPKGGESVEKKIKLVIAVLQLLLAIAELIRLIKALLG